MSSKVWFSMRKGFSITCGSACPKMLGCHQRTGEQQRLNQRQCVRESERDGFKENDDATVAMGTAARFAGTWYIFVVVKIIFVSGPL